MSTRIAIDAQLSFGGESGGVEQFVMELVRALGQLDDGSEEYLVIARAGESEWLRPHLGRNQRLVVRQVALQERLRSSLGPLRKPARRLWRIARHALEAKVSQSNGFYENLGADLLHFPHQKFVHSGLKTIYNPHDLQHQHYPQFFSSEELSERQAVYAAGCTFAQAVAADSRWVKEDLVRQLRLDPGKVFAIPMAAPTAMDAELSDDAIGDVKRRLELPENFVLYPAQTWRHKNHTRLLQALALLRDRDRIRLSLVCTGKRNDFWPTLQKQVDALELTGQVQFLGFVQPLDLHVLYRLAQFVIYPSLFEGGGLPILEAFAEATPIACSAAASMPEYAGDAALLFDPTSAKDISAALKQMATDAGLRAGLTARGRERIKAFTWERTARAYRAIYRMLAGTLSTAEDRQLIAEC